MISCQQPEKDKQHDRANGGVDDEGDGADAEMNIQLRKQPVTDECADDTDDQVSDKPEPTAPHDLTSQPAGNDADQNNDDETFIGKMHLKTLWE